MADRLTRLARATYLAACQFVARSGHYGIKKQYERPPYSKAQKITMWVSAAAWVLAAAAYYGRAHLGLPTSFSRPAGTVATVAMYVLAGTAFFGRPRGRELTGGEES